MTESKKERHHFLPVFYLEGFVDPDNRPYLWIYDKIDGEIRKSSPKDAGLQTNFYAFTTADGSRDSNSFENALGRIETQVAPLWRKIINRQLLDNTEKSNAALFLSLMMTRVPGFRGNFERVEVAAIKQFDMKYARRKGFFEEIRKDWQSKGKKLPDNIDKLEEMICNGEFEVKVNPETSLSVITDRYAPIFHRMGWVFIIAGGRFPFVTSDSPLCFIDPTHDPRSPYGFGLASRNIEVTFPISQDLALVAGWKEYSPPFQRGSERLVRRINHRTVMNASRFVYSSQCSGGLGKLVKKYRGGAPTISIS